jgi:hypothetical protein
MAIAEKAGKAKVRGYCLNVQNEPVSDSSPSLASYVPLLLVLQLELSRLVGVFHVELDASVSFVLIMSLTAITYPAECMSVVSTSFVQA